MFDYIIIGHIDVNNPILIIISVKFIIVNTYDII